MRRFFIFLMALLLALPMAGRISLDSMTPTDWNGGKRYNFKIDGRDAIVVVPDSVAYGRPWIWRPAFFDAFPSADIALLKQGWHVAYYDVTHLYGSPRAVKLCKEFYDEVVPAFGLAAKGVVEGVSRGGYLAFAYAAEYPETVSALYVDAPVCDLLSWPGRGSKLWPDVLKEWGVEDSEITHDFRGNAVSHLPALADAHIPIISVCGAKDTIVPYLENMDVVRRKYQEMGGVVEVIVKPDCDHHPHGLDDPEPVVDFLTRYADGYRDFQHLHLRGSLRNSFRAMAVDRKATVAFLGGSITEMKGWRDMVEEDLRQRFPDTEFTFIDAGIASLGSTPHAFRFENDVLSHGTPDLLFVEAAVNDHTNGFGPREQVLGMEGIVRHALAANPYMDIVMLDFIYDPFIPMLASGETPDVILNHERVANHYHITSIDLAQEISDRMEAGLLTWKQFGGTHPAWSGHKFYAAAINSVFDANTRGFSEYAGSGVVVHEVPEANVSGMSAAGASGGTGLVAHEMPAPVEEFCYQNGKMVSAAGLAEGSLRAKASEAGSSLRAAASTAGSVAASVAGGSSRAAASAGLSDDAFGGLVLKKVKGFAPFEDWTPSIEAGTRPGFVNVPMLSTDKGGSFTLEFEGTAVGLFVVSGPDSGKISYSIDGGASRTLDTHTRWSDGLYLPWVWMLADDLPSGKHTVTVKVPASDGCHIRDFVVNR